jgi:hypothetical protein
MALLGGIALLFAGRGGKGSTELEVAGVKLKTTSVGTGLVAVGLVAVGFAGVQSLKSDQNRVRITGVSASTAGRPNVVYGPTPCPLEVPVEGRIEATGTGTVSYRFIVASGVSQSEERRPQRSLPFSGGGSKAVTDRLVVPIPEGEFAYRVSVEIMSPSEGERSNAVDIRGTCDPTADPPPPTPPPVVAPPSG